MKRFSTAILCLIVLILLAVILHGKDDAGATTSAGPQPPRAEERPRLLSAAREIRDNEIRDASFQLQVHANNYLKQLEMARATFMQVANRWRDYRILAPQAAAMGVPLPRPEKLDTATLKTNITDALTRFSIAVEEYNAAVEQIQLKYYKERARLSGDTEPMVPSEVPWSDLPATAHDPVIVVAFEAMQTNDEAWAEMCEAYDEISRLGRH